MYVCVLFFTWITNNHRPLVALLVYMSIVCMSVFACMYLFMYNQCKILKPWIIMITLKVNILIHNSVYQLIVEKVEVASNLKEKSKRRKRYTRSPCGQDEAIYHDYRIAVIKGLNCYITAQLIREDLDEQFIVGNNETYGGYYNAPLQRGNLYDVWFRKMVFVDGVCYP